MTCVSQGHGVWRAQCSVQAGRRARQFCLRQLRGHHQSRPHPAVLRCAGVWRPGRSQAAWHQRKDPPVSVCVDLDWCWVQVRKEIIVLHWRMIWMFGYSGEHVESCCAVVRPSHVLRYMHDAAQLRSEDCDCALTTSCSFQLNISLCQTNNSRDMA